MKGSTYIIAEAGVNHNGSLARAKELVCVAAEAGVDAVKFQTFKTETVVTEAAEKSEYQLDTTCRNESQLDMLKKLELSDDGFRELKEECQNHGLQFLSTPFDLSSVEFLSGLGLDLWKIPSGEITNLPYLRMIGSFGQEVILSTGMSDLQDVQAALEVLEKAGTSRCLITLLHCNTEYPTPMCDVNLRAMVTLRQSFPHVKAVGYSDHTLGWEVSVAAVTMGASVIEKHFTVDRKLPGPDHKASMEPPELADMVRAIRNIEVALGDGEKKVTPSELKNRSIVRKSIVAAKSIVAGEYFREDNLTAKRPAIGVSPMKWDEVLGSQAKRNYKKDELIDA